jgi:hypothetical protein
MVRIGSSIAPVAEAQLPRVTIVAHRLAPGGRRSTANR